MADSNQSHLDNKPVLDKLREQAPPDPDTVSSPIYDRFYHPKVEVVRSLHDRLLEHLLEHDAVDADIYMHLIPFSVLNIEITQEQADTIFSIFHHAITVLPKELAVPQELNANYVDGTINPRFQILHQIFDYEGSNILPTLDSLREWNNLLITLNALPLNSNVKDSYVLSLVLNPHDKSQISDTLKKIKEEIDMWPDEELGLDKESEYKKYRKNSNYFAGILTLTRDSIFDAMKKAQVFLGRITGNTEILKNDSLNISKYLEAFLITDKDRSFFNSLMLQGMDPERIEAEFGRQTAIRTTGVYDVVTKALTQKEGLAAMNAAQGATGKLTGPNYIRGAIRSTVSDPNLYTKIFLGDLDRFEDPDGTPNRTEIIAKLRSGIIATIPDITEDDLPDDLIGSEANIKYAFDKIKALKNKIKANQSA